MRGRIQQCLYGFGLVSAILGVGLQVAVAEEYSQSGANLEHPYFSEKYGSDYAAFEKEAFWASPCKLLHFDWCHTAKEIVTEFDWNYGDMQSDIAPRNLRVIRRSKNKIQVTWKPPKGRWANNVSYYEILRISSAPVSPTRFFRSAETLSLVDKNVPLYYECGNESVCENDYTYRIRARFDLDIPEAFYSFFVEPVLRDTWYQK